MKKVIESAMTHGNCPMIFRTPYIIRKLSASTVLKGVNPDVHLSHPVISACRHSIETIKKMIF